MEKLNNNIAHIAVSSVCHSAFPPLSDLLFTAILGGSFMATFLAQLNSYCYTTNSANKCNKLAFCSYKDSSDPMEHVGEIEG